MKIKISRGQWEMIGKKAGWSKEAQGNGESLDVINSTINFDSLDNKGWLRVKKIAYEYFDGSEDLFNACWREYLSMVRYGAIKSPLGMGDVIDVLENIATGKVNNPKSRYYMYG